MLIFLSDLSRFQIGSSSKHLFSYTVPPFQAFAVFSGLNRPQLRRRIVATSSSFVWSKFLYHAPTATKYAGVLRQTTSSAKAFSISELSSAATGAAAINFLGLRRRRPSKAARNVYPVAMPSSATMTVFPETSVAGLLPRQNLGPRS